jgi:hypothetical protein
MVASVTAQDESSQVYTNFRFNKIISLLDITHYHLFFFFLFKNNVSETEFCLRPESEALSVGPSQ